MNPLSKAEIQEGLRHLPGLSPAVREILPRFSDDEFDAHELAALVSQDPLLAARVLRLANSPFYGLSRQVGSLREAVVILGFSNMRGLVLSAGLIGTFSDIQSSALSLTTAAAAGTLAKSLRLDHGMALTAGLLHNLGALLLGHFAPAQWRALASEPMEIGDIRLSRERQTFGFDHCELGADIVGQWRFPAPIQSAIRLHPWPSDDPPEALADLVHVAWVISYTQGATDISAFSPGVVRRLGLESPQGEAALAATAEATRGGDGPHGVQ